MLRPILSGRLAKWALFLSEFEINYVPQRAIKGQALANFLGDHPVLAEWELTEEFPDEEIFLVEVLPPWEMYFDGATRRNGAGATVLFVSPRKDLLPYSFVLTQNYSNNEAEYQAILLGLGIAVEMQLPQLNIYDDSALVIKQLIGEFEVKKLKLMPLWRHAGELLAQIPEASLHYVPRSENGPADALAKIAASLVQFDQRPCQIGEKLSQTSFATAHSLSTYESEFKFAEQLQSTFSSTTYSTGGLTKVCSFVACQKKKGCKFSKRHTVEFTARTKLARSSTYKSSDCAITGRRCSETLSKWPELANNGNYMLIMYTRRRNRFTQQSHHGHSKRGGWT
ncbi:hypothetical protein H6P81_006329 [Aristolochia fimbriata]|uniref:RNase H type-1 domain-containing protein n=1 Tax=Aristolochia fimbriata TaxID=158543 RepID=A0AAV7EX04_ARIFI|nr:hypothetical protein H6P81_006329 [Aristolochia fimbriata]